MERMTEQAQNVAHDVREQAENVASDFRVQMSERSIAWRDKGITRLRNLATELRQMAAVPTEKSTAGHEFAHIAADRLDAICSDLENRDPENMVSDARSYARNHPAQVTIGMFAAGLLVGRMVRGASSRTSSRSHSSSPTIDLREGQRYPAAHGTGYIPETGFIS